MRVCLLTDQELENQPLPDDDWPCDPRPYLPDADWTVGVLGKEDAVSRIIALHQEGFDLFFNLCDGAWDEGRVGIEVVQTLEEIGAPFTGATSEFFEPSREAMKRVCHAWGIDTPRYVSASDLHDVERAADTLRFPLIVKHPNGYASTGLTRESRVESATALRDRAEVMMAAYGQTLIEEFIDGGECTVLVAEDPDQLNRPRTFTPIRYRFPEGESFKHEQLKWVDYGGLTTEPINKGALSAMVREASARFFLGMRGAGYGRCDFRIDPDGRPFLLEINPNCGLYYPESDYGSADLCLAHDPMGHMGFTHLIVRAALQRHRRGRPTYRILPRPAGDYGLFANRGFHSGQVVVAREGSAHHLVSREWVEATADSFQRTRLLSHGWPITDHIWAVWSPDPVNWRPINHSCDPNCWLQGLDIVARRDIPEGEEITLEYATFCHEDMPAFECRCAAASCRKRIHGSDMLTEVLAPFGDHLSDYVRRKRQAPHA